MSLGTYTQLKASIAAWVKRTDLEANIPDFITLGEARIARDLRLRIQVIEGSDVTVAGVSSVALPDNWMEFESMSVQGYGRIEPGSPDAMNQRWLETDSGRPQNYAVNSTGIRLWPVPDGVYTLEWSYYARFALSDAAPTNWLLTNHPGIYLWAALAEAEPFTVNDPRTAIWEAKYQAESAKLTAVDERARFGGTPLRISAA